MDRKTLLVGVSILVIVVIAMAVVMFTGRAESFAGTVYNPSVPAANIQLTDQNAKPFDSNTLRGKVVLIFFGYTNCPDECPLAMAKLKQVFDALGSQSVDAQVLLITTDPVRDTPEVLKTYVGHFNPTFIGLTGTLEELQKVWGNYGVAVMDGGQTHSTRIYVIDRSGNLRLTFPAEMQPDAMTSDVKILLSEK